MEDPFKIVKEIHQLLDSKLKEQEVIRKIKSRLRKFDTIDEKVYHLTALWQIISPSVVVNCHKFIQFGLLCGPIHSLSCDDAHVRAIAYAILQRFYCHLESGTDFVGKYFWTGFIDNIRCSMTITNEQLPCIVTSFLAHSMKILTEPVHPLLDPLRKAVINYQKSNDIWRSLKLMLQSSNPQIHTTQINWSLKIIHESCSSGQRNDTSELFNQGVIDLLIKMVSSCSTSHETKVICAEIIEKCSRDEGNAKKLCLDHSVPSFLLLLAIDFSRATKTDVSDKLIDSVIAITRNIQQAFDLETNNKMKREEDTSQIVYRDRKEEEMKLKSSRKRKSSETDDSKHRKVNIVQSLHHKMLLGQISAMLELKQIKKQPPRD